MELQQLDEGGAELTAGYDLVYKAVFQLELAALEALGQALADGLLDDAGACKTDGCARPPRLAKLAVTPPVVGWVNTLMYSPPLAEKRSMAALVLAICIRLKMPSCIRAPPLAEKMTSGSFFAAAYSMARVIFSPTAVLMLPIKKRLGSTAGRDSGLAEARLLGLGAELFGIARETQHVLRGQLCIHLPETAAVQHKAQAVVRTDGLVIAAVGADEKALSPGLGGGTAAALLAFHKLRLMPRHTGIPPGFELEGALPHPAREQVSNVVHRYASACAVR